MFRHSFIVIFLSLSASLMGQHRVDSLKALLTQADQDTTKVNLLNELFSAQVHSNPEIAASYASEAYNLSLAGDLRFGMARSLNNVGYANYCLGKQGLALENFLNTIEICNEIGNRKIASIALANIALVFNSKGNSSKTIEYFEQSLVLAREIGDTARISSLLNNIGVVYFNQSALSKALSYYLQALSIDQLMNNLKGQAYALSNIGLIYDEMGNYSQSLKYYNESLEILQKIGDKIGIAGTLNNIGIVYKNGKDYGRALDNYARALKIAEEIDYYDGKSSSYTNIGELYKLNNVPEKALEFFMKTDSIAQEAKDKPGIALAWSNIGNVYKEKHNFSKALAYFRNSLRISKEFGLKDLIMDNYRRIAEVYSLTGSFEKALQYQLMYSDIRDSIYTAESIMQIADMQAKYDLETKEKEIQLLISDNKLKILELDNKQIMLYAVGSGLVLIMLISVIGFYAYRNRQRARQLLIREKANEAIRETEKMMLSRIVEAEENEKTRFAKDLHDGLGPLLSAVKLYFNELPATNPREEEIRKRTNELLNEAVTSTRTIANNLMPTTIRKYGLVKALDAFCEKVSFSGSIQVDFKADPADMAADKTIEIVLFRVVTELINNTIKHSGAKNVIIRLRKDNQTVRVVYQDDGQGFDYEKIMSSTDKGLGLNNILTRINSVNGTCNIGSSPGNGIHVTIEV
ncbi:MAG: sensor histidine kinase [Bacteroidetes bacterium]|nr:sensor histidine kinase [Bacteroidota bacterium]